MRTRVLLLASAAVVPFIAQAGCAQGTAALTSGTTTGGGGGAASSSSGATSSSTSTAVSSTGTTTSTSTSTSSGTGGMGGGASSASTTAGTTATSSGTTTSASSTSGTGGAAGCPTLLYDEELATVLRGVQIDDATATTLGLAAGGYFQLTEFRVSAMPTDHVIALEVLTLYASCADPAKSKSPEACDPWVFSQFSSYAYDATHYAATVSDYAGHTLAFDITFGTSCNTVTAATLDGLSVGLTTETYTTGVFDTCGWSSEPAFTNPASPCQ